LQPAQQIMKTTAGPFHFLHIRPICHAVCGWFGHTMPSWHWSLAKSLA
jgi:hypothetical protein